MHIPNYFFRVNSWNWKCWVRGYAVFKVSHICCLFDFCKIIPIFTLTSHVQMLVPDHLPFYSNPTLVKNSILGIREIWWSFVLFITCLFSLVFFHHLRNSAIHYYWDILLLICKTFLYRMLTHFTCYKLFLLIC